MGREDARLVVQGVLDRTRKELVVDREAAGRRVHLQWVQELLGILPDLTGVSAQREPQADQVRLQDPVSGTENTR